MSSSLNPANNFKAVIIGGGPAGIGVAVGLAKRDIGPLVIIDKRNELGGIPALYKKKHGAIPTFVRWTRGQIVFGEDYARILRREMSDLDIHTWLQSHVFEIKPEEKKIYVVRPATGAICITADAIILACGSRERSLAERGMLLGARPHRMYFTKNLLDLLDLNHSLPISHPLIIGSDVLAYAAAAKLRATGSSSPILIDKSHRPKCNFFQRFYFHRSRKFEYHGSIHSAEVIDSQFPSEIKLSNGATIECDGIVVSGDLIPNSELALTSSLQAQVPSRKIIVSKNYQLSKPGWFAAGNILGKAHGAEWCYLNGLRVARSVANYLAASRANRTITT